MDLAVRLTRVVRTALLLFALSCTPTPQLAPAPATPPIDYAEALARIARRQAADDSVVVRGGRSILLSHGARTPRVIVLLHGFTDLPTQFESLGKRFFAGGDNVYIPRLPRHAHRVAPIRTLGRVRAEEMASFGDSVVEVARGLADTIIVAGLSAGGAIAANMAQTRREVHRVVLIAPAIAAGRISEDNDRALIILASRLPDIRRTNEPDSTRPDYVQGLTTRGLAEVLRLGQTVRQRATDHDPGAPEMVFLLNELDQTVSEEASLALAQSWFDHHANVAAYRFPKKFKLPHNLMEISERGGNLDLVLPVIEALVRSTPPPSVELLPDPCGGFFCVLRHGRRNKSDP
jgi:pimeloyl-ACP methyl ester carboxylesterase